MGITMNYGKSGNPKPGKHERPHQEHNAKGTAKNPYDARPSKENLLARMKAAAESKKAT